MMRNDARAPLLEMLTHSGVGLKHLCVYKALQAVSIQPVEETTGHKTHLGVSALYSKLGPLLLSTLKKCLCILEPQFTPLCMGLKSSVSGT